MVLTWAWADAASNREVNQARCFTRSKLLNIPFNHCLHDYRCGCFL